MSDDPSPPSEGDRDLRAAEYVLGALPAVEARALEAEAAQDPALSASIAAWEMRLVPLTALIEPTQPPTVLWRRLALATGIESIIQPPRARTAWRGATVAMTALAASLAFLLVTRPPMPAPAAPLVAALSPYGGPGATFLVRVGPDGAATVLAVGQTDVPSGRALELWAVAGTSAPVSMGLLPASGRITLTIPAGPGTQLLVSQEPAGGSPTKAPTGPVVYAGTLTGI